MGSPEEPPVEPAATSLAEVPSIEPPAAFSAEVTGAAEQPSETLPPDEILGEPPTPSEGAQADLQPTSPLTGEPEVDQSFGGDWLNTGESVWRTFVALLVVLALICLSVFVLKRLIGGAPVFLDQRLGRVIGRIHLSPKAILYLVKVGDKVLVIGTTPTAISLVAEVTDPEIVSQMEGTRTVESAAVKALTGGRMVRFFSKFSGAQRTVEEDVRFEEYLRDIRGQMEKLNALIGGPEDEEER